MVKLRLEEYFDLIRSVVRIVVLEHEKSGLIRVGESHESIAHVNVLALLYQLTDLLGFLRLERTGSHLCLDISRLGVVKLVGARVIGSILDFLKLFV